MPTRGGGRFLTQEDLRARMAEIQERIDMMDRREKQLDDLRNWMQKAGWTTVDLLWGYRQLQPKRADTPVKSKKPVHPAGRATLRKALKSKDGRYYIAPGSLFRGKPESIKFVSPDGRFVWGGMGRQPVWYAEHLKKGGALQDISLKPNGAAR